MKENILVSIIIPTYNSEKTIAATLDSLLKQTYSKLEIIIIDGASKDKTVAIANRYSQYWGKRLIISSEKDKGIYDAMNKGIRKASGILIGILSSNDTFEPQAVEHIVNGYDERKPDCIIYGMQRYITDGKETCVAIYSHTNLPNKMMAHPSCFVSKSVYEKYGVFDINYKSSADYEFLWRMYDNSAVTFKPVYGIVANFNTGGISGTRQGYLETIYLRYTKGQISKRKYKYICLKCFFSKLIKG